MPRQSLTGLCFVLCCVPLRCPAAPAEPAADEPLDFGLKKKKKKKKKGFDLEAAEVCGSNPPPTHTHTHRHSLAPCARRKLLRPGRRSVAESAASPSGEYLRPEHLAAGPAPASTTPPPSSAVLALALSGRLQGGVGPTIVVRVCVSCCAQCVRVGPWRRRGTAPAPEFRGAGKERARGGTRVFLCQSRPTHGKPVCHLTCSARAGGQ